MLGTADQLFFDQLEATWLADEQLVAQARANPIENFRLVFNETFLKSIVGRMDDNEDIFRKILDDDGLPGRRDGPLPAPRVRRGADGRRAVSDPSGSVTLHEEIADILREHGGGWMSTRELAAEVNRAWSVSQERWVPGRAVPDPWPDPQLRPPVRAGRRIGSVSLGSRRVHCDDEALSRSREAGSGVRGPPAGLSVDAVRDALAGRTGRTGPSRRPSRYPPTCDCLTSPACMPFHGDTTVWKELQLGTPPDDRPLYVGKSESSLHGRDVRTHFADGRTGSSTLRRSFAALLHDMLGLRGMPRNPAAPGYFHNYGLSATDDAKLTAWMLRRLRIAVWPASDGVVLEDLERRILGTLKPPLNLKDVVTPWSNFVSARRRVMAKEAESWRAQP